MYIRGNDLPNLHIVSELDRCRSLFQEASLKPLHSNPCAGARGRVQRRVRRHSGGFSAARRQDGASQPSRHPCGRPPSGTLMRAWSPVLSEFMMGRWHLSKDCLPRASVIGNVHKQTTGVKCANNLTDAKIFYLCFNVCMTTPIWVQGTEPVGIVSPYHPHRTVPGTKSSFLRQGPCPIGQ